MKIPVSKPTQFQISKPTQFDPLGNCCFCQVFFSIRTNEKKSNKFAFLKPTQFSQNLTNYVIVVFVKLFFSIRTMKIFNFFALGPINFRDLSSCMDS